MISIKLVVEFKDKKQKNNLNNLEGDKVEKNK